MRQRGDDIQQRAVGLNNSDFGHGGGKAGAVRRGLQRGEVVSILSSLMTVIKPASHLIPAVSPVYPSSSSYLKLGSSPIRAKGSCRDSSCMAEEKVIKRRRPKEEVKGPDELLPPVRTHQVLGTGNFSQGGSVWSVFHRPGPALRSVYSLSPHHRPMMTPSQLAVIILLFKKKEQTSTL